MNEEELLNELSNRREAYKKLYTGADTLLNGGRLFFTERWLLRLVRALYSRRLAQIGGFLPEDEDEL